MPNVSLPFLQVKYLLLADLHQFSVAWAWRSWMFWPPHSNSRTVCNVKS